MDISKIDKESKSLFGSAYEIAATVFDCEPASADEKKQKKICKWLKKTYISDGDLEEQPVSFFSRCSDGELIGFCLECKKAVEEEEKTRLASVREALEEFSEDVKKAFLYLAENMWTSPCPEKRNDGLGFILNSSCAFSKVLILYTDEEYSFKEYNELDLSDMRITKLNGGYCLEFKAEDYERERSVPVKLYFTRAEVEVKVFRAHERFMLDYPWDHIGTVAAAILSKNELGDEYFNQRELALLPLLRELEAFWGLVDGDKEYSFELLAEYAEKHNAKKVLARLKKLSPFRFKDEASRRSFGRLKALLCKSENEPLFRELYGLIVQSQEGYESQVQLKDADELEKMRGLIEEKLHSLGFSGSYPLFTMIGPMKKIRLEQNYGMSYFVGKEKRVKYTVFCVEDSSNSSFDLQFNCATAFLKKGEGEDADVFSCTFDAEGKRLFKSFILSDDELDALGEMTQIAAKKAMCEPITKKEKGLLSGNILFDWKSFILVSLVCGGLFAVLFLAAMFLICCSVTSVVLGVEHIGEMIGIMPWGLLFAICFFGFGIAMAVTEALASRK